MKYEEPNIEIVIFKTLDVICASVDENETDEEPW